MNAREAFDLTQLMRKDVTMANAEVRECILKDPKFAVDCFKKLANKEPLASMSENMQAAVSACAMAKLLEMLVELPREVAGNILSRDN